MLGVGCEFRQRKHCSLQAAILVKNMHHCAGRERQRRHRALLLRTSSMATGLTFNGARPEKDIPFN